MSTLDPTEIPGNDSTTRQIFGTSSVDADFSLIDSGFDRDWFRIDLSADVPYYFRVQSSEYLFDVTGLPDDTPLLSDPAVSLYSPTVGYIPRLQRDAEGAGKDYAFLVFTPSASGTYYVEASAASGGTGAYRISAGPLDWALPTGIAPQLVLPAGGTVAVDAPIVLATEGDLPNPGRGTAVLYKGEGPSRTFVTDFNFNAPSATNMTLSWADATVRLDPPGTLEPGTVYTLSVREDFLRNRIDEPSAAIEFRFTTAGSAPGSGDDHPNDAAAGTAIAVDAPATGVIGAARDVDWFRVTLAAGATYAVTLDRTDVSATLDPFLVLQQPDGTTLTNDDVAIGNRNARIEFTAPTSGTYALRASDVFQQKTGAYRISVTEIVIDDHGDDAADATLMSPGTAADGSLERDGDIDWFRVELVAGREYTFSLQTNTAMGGLASPRLAVLDEFGTTLGTAIDDLLTDPAPRFTLKSPSGGTHFVQVASNLAPTMTGGYRLRVDEVDDHPDDPTVGTEILVDSAIDGRIGAARDVDWFRVAFSAGQTYAITLDRTGAAPVLNPFLVLRLPDGTTVTNSDAVWGEWNSRLEFAAPVDGTYAIQASDTLQQETGGYRLAIARLEVDDHGSTVETATRISAGTFVDGALERDDDQDWFRVDLIAGLDYEFRLETNTATGGLGTPRISVLDASGATLGTATDDLLIDPAPTLTVRPDSGGAHFLQVTSTPAQDMTGTYRVRVREVDDRPAGEVGALEVGTSVSGRIAPAGDDDRFAVNLVEGDRYVLRLETTLGALNPAVTVIAPDGTSFRATREEGAAAELQYTAPVTGRYEVRADDKSGQGTGNYALSITREETPPVRDLKVQRLEGAFIYADLNGNNRADPEEDTGLSTDTRGLATGALPTNVSLLAIGGVNIDTGLPNRLTLIAPAGGTLISPLTTAVEHVQDLSGRSTSEARMLVARVLGLDPGIDLLEYDPLAQAPGDPAALAVQKAAVQVAVMADGLRNGDQLFARLAALSIERSTTPDLTLLETLAFLTDRQPSGLELRAVAGWIEALQSIDSATELPQAQKEWTAALLLLSVLEEFGVWVQDGYVAGATLFADLNENNRPDPWEDTGLVTNAGGLAEGLLPTNASLIAVGGTNIDTGLPNTLTLMAPAGGGLVNPITTLIEFAGDLSSLGIDASREKISAALGLDPGIDPLTYDPLAQPPGDPLALAVQKAAVRIAVVAGAVGSPSANLFRLAALSVESAVPIDLTNAETLAEVLDLEVDDPLLGAIATGLDAIEAAETLSSVAEAQAAATVALDLAILPAISISTTRLEVAEGDAGATLLAFRVDRTGDLTGASSLQWRVEGDQIDTSDFVGGVLPSGTLDFAVGEAAKTITIEARGDTAFEADEPVTVTLVSATGARIETAAAQVTILNDDALPLLSIAATDATRNEGNGGTTDFTFTVTRSGDTSGAASANWAAGSAIGMQASSPEGNATAADADFEGGTLPSGTIRFAAGETSKTISIAVVGDAAFEADEAFTVTLSAPSGATLGTVTAAGTIVNDDVLPTLSIAATSASLNEGNSGSTIHAFTVTRSGDTSGAASANWTVGSSTATGPDFEGGQLPSGTVRFAAGETSTTVTIAVAGDTAFEADEAFTVTLSAPSGATLGTVTAAGTIVNDDALPVLAIAPTASSQNEGNGGTTNYNFTVTRSGDTSGASSANWAVSSGSASGTDFIDGALPSGTVSFVAGETSKPITVAVAGDTAFEADEAFTVTLSAPSGATLGTVTAAGTIVNDDALPTLSIAARDANRDEGNDNATDFTFTVTRSGDTSGTSSASWAVGVASGMETSAPEDGAIASAADFADGTLPSGTVSFAAGESSKIVTVVVVGDTAFEPDETFAVTLSNPIGGTVGAASTATGTILNDDTAVVPGVTVNGTAGNDSALTGGAGNDTITGFAGTDTLTGTGGDDRLDGGSGLPSERDLAIFSGPISGYTLARAGATLTIADATPGRDGTDTATNLEKLQFSDMGVNLTVQATAASIDPATLDRICELYLGFFARVPAADGIENWVNQFKAGKSLNAIADDFYGIGSSEALRSVTGYWDFTNDRPLSDQDFVRIAYRNVLGREGLEGGITYWAAELTGPQAKTRGELVGTMLDAARGLTGDTTWGWVAQLLDDKVLMSKRVAVDWGLNYGANASEAITKGVEIANAIDESPNPNPAFAAIPVKTFDFAEATALIGINPAGIDLIA